MRARDTAFRRPQLGGTYGFPGTVFLQTKIWVCGAVVADGWCGGLELVGLANGNAWVWLCVVDCAKIVSL